ncbi:hypothetical protein, partial [Luteimonas salinilitoris]
SSLMLDRLLGHVFGWRRARFAGSRRWWILVACVLAASFFSAIHASIQLFNGWQYSIVRPLCFRRRRFCNFEDHVLASVDPTLYWLYMSMWAFVAVCCIALLGFCFWIWFRRSEL